MISRVIRNCSASFVPEVIAKVDKALVDDLRPRLCSNVTSQIDVKFTGDLQIVRGPGVSLRIEEIDTPAACNRDEWISFGRLTVELRRLQMQARQAAHDFKMTKLLGADVHQEILAIWIFAIKALYRILHGGSQLTVRTAELLEEHIAEARIGFVDSDCKH